jgi:hypothetical protein
MKKAMTVALSVFVLLSLAMPNVAFSSSLSDISGDRNEIAIQYLYDKGIVSGYPDGTFKPNNGLNRAEMLKILVGAIGLSPSVSDFHDCFPDVKSEWFAPYVCYAKSLNWVSGYPDGTFGPAVIVNKAETLKMLLNTQKITLKSATGNVFSDVPKTDWYAIYVETAESLGLLEETSGNYHPGDSMERGTVSENLYRALLLDQEQQQVPPLPQPQQPGVDKSCTESSCSIQYLHWTGTSAGKHENLWIGNGEEKTEAIYYIPKNFNAQTAQYWLLIHGAGFCHRAGALTHIDQWDSIADKENLVLIAPNFDRIYYKADGTPDYTSSACGNYEKYCGGSGDSVQDPHLKCSDYPYKSPNSFLWDFVYMLATYNSSRHDQKMFEIFSFFNSQLMSRSKFNLYGHSGGGQFVSRFMMLYPEKLINVGDSAAGTMLFPVFDHEFPYGLDMSSLSDPHPMSIFRGNQVNDLDLINLTESALNSKMAKLLDLNVLLVDGANDQTGNCNDRPDAVFQGCYPYQKMQNYYNEMSSLHEDFVDEGLLPQGHQLKMSLNILQGVGHDNVADGDFAIGYFYPQDASCKDSDNGRNYYVKASASKGTSTQTDYCSASSPEVVREFYCENNEVKWESHTCPNGCSDGVCL